MDLSVHITIGPSVGRPLMNVPLASFSFCVEGQAARNVKYHLFLLGAIKTCQLFSDVDSPVITCCLPRELLVVFTALRSKAHYRYALFL